MLRFSEAANLAIHAMAHMISLPPGKYASAGTLAEILASSPSHLAKVLNGLAHKDLLISSRGAKGGFRLPENGAEISTLQIIQAVDGPLPEASCLLGRPICRQSTCAFQDLFAECRERIVTRLQEVRLVDIAKHA